VRPLRGLPAEAMARIFGTVNPLPDLEHGREPLDTRTPASKLILTILAVVAIWKREIMLERQLEGIAKAHAEGRCKGWPPAIDVAEIKRPSAKMGAADTAKRLGIARA
jgi:DNA invertase Pin-like site-specific DNA recombinase